MPPPLLGLTLTHSLPDYVGRGDVRTPETALTGCPPITGEMLKYTGEDGRGHRLKLG